MTTPNVESALLQSFQDGAFGLSYEMPNQKFTPIVDVAWAKISFISTIPSVFTQGNTGDDKHTGILQIDLKYPLNKGMKDINDKCEALRVYYKHGKDFTYSGQVVTIREVGKRYLGNVGGWSTSVISVDYISLVSRV